MRLRIAAAAAAVAVSLAGCAPAHPRDDARSRAEVEALVRDWGSAGEEGRWGDLKSLYADAPGFVWIEQGRIAYPDHAAVVAGVEAARAAKARIRSTIADVVVTPLGPDAAAFHARSTMTVATASFSFAFDGVLSGVAVKRDGAWKLLQGHLSAPPAQPATAPTD